MDYFRQTWNARAFFQTAAGNSLAGASFLIRTTIYYLIIGIRPLLGPRGCCKYEVSCTAFAGQQLATENVPRALWNIFWRVLSCNPFTK